VLKTDVASYYASIDPVKLLDRLARVVADRDVLNLVAQMIYRVSERGRRRNLSDSRWLQLRDGSWL
jgi:hypothetical protein